MASLVDELQRLGQTLEALQKDLDVSHAIDVARSEVGSLVVSAMPSLITRTTDVHGSGGPFIGDPTIQLFEPKIQALADAALVLIAMVAFYRIMWGHGLFSQYTVRIMLPRLAASAALINFSPQLVQAGVDLDNVLSSAVLQILGGLSFATEIQHTLNDFFPFPFLSPLVTLSVAAGFLVLGFGYVVRYALLVLLAILAPGAALLMVLPDTAHYAKAWVSLFISTLLMQPLQLLILAVGLDLEFTGTNWWGHGFALASLWICFKVPGALHSVSSIGTHAEGFAHSHLRKALLLLLK